MPNLIELGGNHVDPAQITGLLEALVENGNGVSEFEAQPNTTVVLSTGHSFVVKRTPEAVRKLRDDAVEKSGSVDPYVEHVCEAFLEYLRKITEHLHTISEHVTRLSIGP